MVRTTRRGTHGAAVVAVMAVLGLAACADRSPGRASAPEPTGVVSGTVRGTPVVLENATFDGDLALYEEGGWGFSPSLLLFLFLDDSAPPEGREIVVEPDGEAPSARPHVHYRWRDPATGELDVDSVTDGYRLRLVFDRVEDGALPGTIVFDIPGEDTHVEGAFSAVIRD